MVHAVLDFCFSETLVVKRIVYDYALGLRSDIEIQFLNFDLYFICVLDIDATEMLFDQFVFGVLNRHIYRRDISERKSVYS